MKSLLVALLCLPILAHSQTIKETTFRHSGKNCNMIYYIPENVSGSVPAVVFVPGNGEVGNNAKLLYGTGPMEYVAKGWKPPFAVISVQPDNGWASAAFLHSALEYIEDKLPVSMEDISLTGLSGGAHCIYDYIKSEPVSTYVKPHAVVVFSITPPNPECENGVCGTDTRFATFPSWGISGWWDSHSSKMRAFHQKLIKAGYNARWTTYGSSESNAGHCCWSTYYNPSWNENGLSIYDFMVTMGTTPVEYSAYDIFLRKNQVWFEWETSQESENSRFIIEESEDGVNFEEIATIPSKAVDGNSSTPIKYTFHL